MAKIPSSKRNADWIKYGPGALDDLAAATYLRLYGIPPRVNDKNATQEYNERLAKIKEQIQLKRYPNEDGEFGGFTADDIEKFDDIKYPRHLQ